MKEIFILASLIVLTACSSKPVLYPNTKLKLLGKTRADLDVKRCISDADKFLKTSRAKQVMRSTGFGAFVGGTIGVLKGVITGGILQNAVEGAAYGSAGGAAAGTISPDELKRKYVNLCLSEKGYRVVGWD